MPLITLRELIIIYYLYVGADIRAYSLTNLKRSQH